MQGGAVWCDATRRAELKRRPCEEEIHLLFSPSLTRRDEHSSERRGVPPAGEVARGSGCGADSARERRTSGDFRVIAQL